MPPGGGVFAAFRGHIPQQFLERARFSPEAMVPGGLPSTSAMRA